MSSNADIFNLIDKAADRLGWVEWSLNQNKQDSVYCERALQYLCNVLTHRMKGDTVMTNIGSDVLPDEEIVPTLQKSLHYLLEAIEEIEKEEGESRDYTECRLAVPDIQESIKTIEANGTPI